MTGPKPPPHHSSLLLLLSKRWKLFFADKPQRILFLLCAERRPGVPAFKELCLLRSLIYLYTTDFSTSCLSRLSSWSPACALCGLDSNLKDTWMYLLWRRTPFYIRWGLTFPFCCCSQHWNGVAWFLPPNRAASAPLPQWQENDLAPTGGAGLGGQSLQSSMPSLGFNPPSLRIRSASCDEPLKGVSSSGLEIAMALHGCRDSVQHVMKKCKKKGRKKALQFLWFRRDGVGVSEVSRRKRVGPNATLWLGRQLGCQHTRMEAEVIVDVCCATTQESAVVCLCPLWFECVLQMAVIMIR